MPRKQDVLYPPNYTEPEATIDSGVTPHRDIAAVQAILRDVTATEELSIEQLVRLISGNTLHHSPTPALDVTVPEEREAAIEAAKICKQSLRSPECGKSLRRREVVDIIRAEITERSKGWKFLGEERELGAADVAEPVALPR